MLILVKNLRHFVYKTCDILYDSAVVYYRVVSMLVTMEFYQAFQQALSTNNKDIKTIAAKLKVSTGYLYRIVHNKEYPSEKTIKSVMKFLSFPSDYNYVIDMLIHNRLPQWLVKKLKDDPDFLREFSILVNPNKIDDNNMLGLFNV